MKLSVNQPAPDFTTTDVFGNIIQMKKLTGQKVYLAFERNAGCPVCNLYVHQLIQRAVFFKQHNIKIILVYESSLSKMKEYLGEESYSFHFVADPENKLYALYGIERSYAKVFKGLLNGLIGKAMAGGKLFKKPTTQDGHINTIPSAFLINESGLIEVAHYGSFVGDHIPIDVINSFATHLKIKKQNNDSPSIIL
jgi:peroxiredoxin